jgi:hypothetical protein
VCKHAAKTNLYLSITEDRNSKQKGMEGDADTNRDGKITVGEMHQYLSENVQRHAIALNRTQEPQLVDNSARVLVGR